jgi:Holliday junction resolvase-like predicted endonuclease
MPQKIQAKHLIEGNAAEQLAALFLQKKGLKLVERNFRCAYGEIDLIMHVATHWSLLKYAYAAALILAARP